MKDELYINIITGNEDISAFDTYFEYFPIEDTEKRLIHVGREEQLQSLRKNTAINRRTKELATMMVT